MEEGAVLRRSSRLVKLPKLKSKVDLIMTSLTTDVHSEMNESEQDSNAQDLQDDIRSRLFQFWEKSKVKLSTRYKDDASEDFDKMNSLDGTQTYQESVVIYTDGACSDNGSKLSKSQAGIGVYFGYNCKYNLSE